MQISLATTKYLLCILARYYKKHNFIISPKVNSTQGQTKHGSMSFYAFANFSCYHMYKIKSNKVEN